MRGAGNVPEPDEARVGLTGLGAAAERPSVSVIIICPGTPMSVRMWTSPPKLPLGDAPGIPSLLPRPNRALQAVEHMVEVLNGAM